MAEMRYIAKGKLTMSSSCSPWEELHAGKSQMVSIAWHERVTQSSCPT
jgi:hypothetical protein